MSDGSDGADRPDTDGSDDAVPLVDALLRWPAPGPDDRGAAQRVAVARGAVTVVGLLVILAWPDRDPPTTAKLLGIVTLAVVVVSALAGRLFALPRGAGRRRLTVRLAVLAVIGVALTAWPDATSAVLGRVLGAGLVVLGVGGIVTGLRRRDGDGSPTVLRGVAMGTAGLVPLLFPEATVNALLVLLVVAWGADAALSLVYLRAEGGSGSPAAAWVLAWLERFPMDDDLRSEVSSKLYFEGAASRDRLWRYGILIVLSTSIATLGIFTDSTAVVIGAMLMAPLMTPIMGTSAALVSVWPARAVRALATVAAGVVLAVLVSWVLTALFVGASDPVLASSQITSRVEPTLTDLLIALAAGAAGAFAVTRPDVADSLPGVAIAVALVPPLAVVGITLRIGEYDDIVGAALLFLTNLVGIILVSGMVFLVTGFVPLDRLRRHGADVRRSFTVVAVLLVLIALPLALTGRRLAADQAAYDEAQSSVERWLVGTDLQIVELDVSGADVDVVVAGDSSPPDVDQLGRSLERALDRRVVLTVEVVPTTRLTYEGDG